MSDVARVRQIDQRLSNKIANMGFVLTCLVVLIYIPVEKNGMPINDFVLRFIKGDRGFASIAVPLFFVISGFFLGRHFYEEGWYCKALASRVRTLAIPFFALNAIWFPIKFGAHYIGVLYFGANDSSPAMQITFYNVAHQLGLLPWGGNAVIGLWYVRALFYLVVASPLFAFFIRKRTGGWMLPVLFVAWCVQDMCQWPDALISPMRFEFNVRCPLYFALGLCISQYDAFALFLRRTHVKVIVCSVGFMAFLLRILCAINNSVVAHLVSFVMTIGLGVLVFTCMPEKKWPKILVGNSFPLFVIHGMAIYMISIMFKSFGCYNVFMERFGAVPLFCAVVALSIMVAQSLKVFTPRFAKLVFGGR